MIRSIIISEIIKIGIIEKTMFRNYFGDKKLLKYSPECDQLKQMILANHHVIVINYSKFSCVA
jgi:hypothetical protein